HRAERPPTACVSPAVLRSGHEKTALHAPGVTWQRNSTIENLRNRHESRPFRDVATPYGRLPVRRGALRHACRTGGEAACLPLPDVPAGDGRGVCGARRLRQGQAGMDARSAGLLRLVQSGETRLLPGLRYAADV